MQNLEVVRDDIKAIATNCTGSPTEKLIAILIASGISDNATLAAIAGIGLRAVQSARKRTRFRETECGEPGFAHQDSQTHQVSPENEPGFAKTHQDSRPEPRAPARIESPSGIVISKLEVKEDSPFRSPEPEKPKAKQQRGTRLPSDWQLPDGWRTWTRTRCLTSTDETVDIEALKFANYWQSLPTSKACKLDWEKTWQNWCLKAFATAPVRHAQTRNDWRAEQRSRLADARAILDRMHIGGSA